MATTPIRVILADDHAVVRKGIREFLTEPGNIDVIAEASDGEEAINLIDQLRPDVAVLDIQMPKRSGIEICRHVRAQHWPIGILILTAYDDAPYVLAVLQAGANGYVLKTADADDIIQAVYDVDEGKSVLDPTIARKLMTQLAGQPLDKPIESLTPREADVLKLAAQGLTNKAIGAQLNVSVAPYRVISLISSASCMWPRVPRPSCGPSPWVGSRPRTPANNVALSRITARPALSRGAAPDAGVDRRRPRRHDAAPK